MKTAIRFFTRSKKGNTKKLADAVSAATGVEALPVAEDLAEKVDREVTAFLERNRDKIGEVVNMNTSASGKSTRKAVAKTTDRLGIPLSEKEFHCAASWIFLNRGRPTEEDLSRAGEFAKSFE